MSFKSREKKRRRKAAIGNVRAKHGEAMKARHYLTIVIRNCCCNSCGNPLRRGAEAVFRHTPREILCTTCTERQAIKFRTSRSWDRQRRAGGNRTPPPAPRPRKNADARMGDGLVAAP